MIMRTLCLFLLYLPSTLGFPTPNIPRKVFSRKHEIHHFSLHARLFDDSSSSPNPPPRTISKDNKQLSAAMVGELESTSLGLEPDRRIAEPGDIVQVASASLLITANTVGASMITLPEFASAPGMAISTALFFAIFCVNLFSGITLAEVAIKQYESSGCQIPSSFKEFADENFQNKLSGNVISSLSIFINWCVLSFALIRAGEIGYNKIPFLSSLDANVSIVGVASVAALLWSALVSTQTDKTLSRIASVCVTVLFTMFSGMLIPGLITIHDPLSIILTPGTSMSEGGEGLFSGVSSAIPIFVTALVYQNIVPTITKLLDYDRKKTTTAIFIGSLLPMLIYLSWCFVVLGGSVNTSLATSGILFTIFSVCSITGSSLACVMSLVGEFECYLSPGDSCSVDQDIEQISESEGTSIGSVALAVLPPLLAGILFSGGEDFTAALSAAGSYGSPILYGVIPALMAWNQRKRYSITATSREEVSDTFSNKDWQEGLNPIGDISLVILGLASGGYIVQNLFDDFGALLAGAS